MAEGSRTPSGALPAEPALGAATDPAPADRFADSRWERRVAGLEQALRNKNRDLLELQRQLEQREQRLRLALERLREADASIDSQASLVMLAEEGGGVAAAVAPDAPASLAAEKGVLESRERALRQERTRLLNDAKTREQTIAALKRSLESAKSALHQRDRRIAEQQRRVEDTAARGQAAESAGEHRAEALSIELARAKGRAGEAEAAVRRAEQEFTAVTQQADLYRKNLIGAEETIAQRERELSELRVQAKRLERERDRSTQHGREAESQRDAEAATRGLAERLAEQRERHRAHTALEYARSREQVAGARRELDHQTRLLTERQSRTTAAATDVRAENERLHSETIRLRDTAAEAVRRAEAAGRATTIADSRALAAAVYGARSLLQVETRVAMLAAEHGLVPHTGPPRDEADGTVGSILRWIRRGP